MASPDKLAALRRATTVLHDVLQRDHWVTPTHANLRRSFAELGMAELDLFLLLCEVEMRLRVDVPDALIGLRDSPAYLTALLGELLVETLPEPG